MKKIFSIIILCSLLGPAANSQNTDFDYEAGYEINSAAELKKISAKVKKDKILDVLNINFSLTENDFPYLNHILSLTQVVELQMDFATAPSPELLKNIHDVAVLHLSFTNDTLLKSLRDLNWESNELVSIRISSASSIKYLPSTISEATFIDLYKTDEEDMLYYGFEKNGEPVAVSISSELVAEDSTDCISNMRDKFGSVVITDIDEQKNKIKKNVILKENGSDFRTVSEVPIDDWTIDNTRATILKSSQNSLILVPTDAFVTKKGKAYHGFVDFYYREWTSMDHMINSKLPMNFENNEGDTVYFITNGMFEIRAYDQNGDELKLDRNKSVNVLFQTIQPNNDGFNLYSYNEVIQTWDNNGTAAQNTSKALLNQLNTKKNNLQLPIQFKFDTTRYENRWSNPAYINTIDFKKKRGKIHRIGLWQLYSRKSMLLSKPKERYANSKNVLQPVFRTIQINDSLNYYLMTFSEKTYEMYPELRRIVYNGFWIPEGVSLENFKKDFFTFKSYNDFRITYEGNGVVLIDMKSIRGHHKIKVLMNPPGRKVSKYRDNTFRKRFKRYEKLTKRRADLFDAYIAHQMSKEIKKYSSMLYSSICIELSNPTLGLFNIDAENRMIAKKELLPVFTSDGVTLNVVTVQVVDTIANGVYTYSPIKVVYSPVGLSTIVVMDNLQNSYKLDQASIDRLKSGIEGKQTLNMVKFKTKNEMNTSY